LKKARPQAGKQSGYVLLVAVAILLMASVAVTGKLAATFRTGALTQASTVQAQRLAKEAKWALIGYAAATTNKPGTLPCPDPNGDGRSTALAGKCHGGKITTNRISGCLPWATLGLERGTDESGARLLYALSTSWRNQVPTNKRTPGDETTANSFRPINPGNYGSIDLHFDSAGATTTVAAIISPGTALPGQNRNSVSETSVCSGNYLAYLESGTDNSGTIINNAFDGGALLSAQSSNAFNDRILSISRDEMFKPLLIPVLRLFADGTGKTNFGLPYYFTIPPSSPTNLLSPVTPTPTAMSQKAASIINRLAYYNAFDLAIIPKHADMANPGAPDPVKINVVDTTDNCAVNDNNVPVDWLCFNNWYQYLTFSASPQSYAVSFVLDRTRTSRSCIMSSGWPYTSESLTCAN